MDFHFHQHLDQAFDRKLDLILEGQKTIRRMLRAVIQKEELLMSAMTDALDQAEAAAKANSDADDAAEQLLVALAAMIADLKQNVTDPAALARISALAEAIKSRADRLGAAVVAGTPAAPAPV